MKHLLKIISRVCLIPVVLAVVGYVIRCTQPVAGGTSTTDNPKIVGTILGDDNLPAANTRVMLMTQQFDPQRDYSDMIIDTTDELGHFTLPVIDTGVYNIQAIHLAKSTQLLIQGITVAQGEDSVVTENDTLEKTGSVIIDLPDSVDHSAGYIYIPGTTIFAPIENLSIVTLNSVPATTLPGIRYATKNSLDNRILRYDIRVFPGALTEVTMLKWKHAVTMCLNTAITGADVEGTITNFPLCVRLNNNNFKFSQARTDGGDVRFTKKDGTPLMFETELWDNVSGHAVLWVKIDTVYGNDSTQSIVMYWGNELVSRQTENALVFDSTGGAAAVLHLGGDVLDVSSSRNDGSVCSATDTNGIIGKCKKFNGNDSILIPGLMGMPSNITLCAWIKQDSVLPRGGGEVVSIGDAALIRTDYEINGFGTGGAVHRSDTTEFNHLGSGRFLKKTGWHFVAFTFNGASFMSNVYIDGVPSGSRNDPGSPVSYSNVGQNSYIGKHARGKKEFNFIGCIDEVRVYRKVKSADFIKLSYMNQRTDDKLLVYK